MTDTETTAAPTKSLTGACLCGAIAFSFTPKAMHADVCHCSMCRRWSGGPALGVEAGSALEIKGEENLAVYKSSDWGERCFCQTCGSNLFWRSPELGMVSVMAGALDDLSGFEMTMQIFIDRKPDFYSFANETKTMTEAEVFAAFAPPSEDDKPHG